MTNIIPVLMAGGAGTRLWPLSRSSYPKQFSKLIGEYSLFQQTARRFSSSSKLSFEPHLTVTNSDFRFIVGEQLQSIGIDPGPILIEPSKRNTGPAVLAAAFYALQQDPEAILVVTPSDHMVPDQKSFHEAILAGVYEIENGKKIVTFGIKPDRPSTSYGYLEVGAKGLQGRATVSKFIEKPNLGSAEKMLETGRYLWNAGIFLFRAKDIVESFNLHCPSLIEPVKIAVQRGKADLGFWRLEPSAWSKCEDISVDYAVMEKEKDLVAIPYDAGWYDLGEWDAVWQHHKPDENGVVTTKNATAIECKNVLLRSENEAQEVVGIGLENIVVVAMPDAVLISDKDRSQEVKEAVRSLKIKGAPQAEFFSKYYRPWGWFEILFSSEYFQVKRIFVKPGGVLSLQSHKHRSEHWVVVQGIAKATIDKQVKMVSEGESVYVPLGTVHRIENNHRSPMLLIEVQTGTYFGEDDIVRYEDVYDRS